MNKENESKIGNFYKGRSIFIAGATGFIGKVLVEKLLRSCNEVKKIYILLRMKKDRDPLSRLEELISAKIFDKIRDENSNTFNNLVAVEGDITKEGLGISETDLNTLVNDVSVVFHCAANVKFDEPLKIAVEFNLKGTRRIVEICHKMPKLVVNFFFH
jgi:fatty acyl-CoA reductase